MFAHTDGTSARGELEFLDICARSSVTLDSFLFLRSLGSLEQAYPSAFLLLNVPV